MLQLKVVNHQIKCSFIKRVLWCYRIAILHGLDQSTFGALPRLLRQRSGYLWVEYVLQDICEILVAENCCHMVAVEGDVRKYAPGVWSG